MKTRNVTANRLSRPVRRRAFTITELLIVVGIIALLISILTPSLVNVKKIARSAKTAGLIKGIGDGLEMFHADHVVGGDYPPSFWRAPVRDYNPYEADNQPDDPNTKSPYNAQGAQTLVWGLAGADLQGTPGFNGLMADLYRLDNARRPLTSRRDPFVDITKTPIRKPDASTMRIDAVTRAKAYLPVIMDDFDMPLLYYKARADSASDPLNIYNPADASFVNDNRAFIEGLSSNASQVHPLANTRLYHDDNLKLNLTAFQKYIRNVQVPNAYRPHNPDTFLLISAGPDQLYGTDDDVTNFPLNIYNYGSY